MSQYNISLAGQTVTVVSVPSSPGFRSVQFSPADAVGLVRSVFTGQAQAQQWPGADLLSGTLTLPSLSQAQADDWIAFLMQCRGMANAFPMSDPAQKKPRGTSNGTPFVDNSQNGGNLPGSQWLGTKGWAPGAVGVLLRGDWIQVGWRLYRVLDDITADGAGNALLPIWPSLRETPTADGGSAPAAANGTASITYAQPVSPAYWGAQFEQFQFAPGSALPADAVVQGIYGVAVVTAAPNGALTTLSYGHGINVASVSNFGTYFNGWGAGATIGSPTQFQTNSLGASISLLNGLQAGISVRASTGGAISPPGTISLSALGFAIYYTSATPSTDTTMSPPITVPAGQGVAWALPVSAYGIGSGAGSAMATGAAGNGALVLNSPRGLFRLSKNSRDWSADFTRRTSISIPIEEYR